MAHHDVTSFTTGVNDAAPAFNLALNPYVVNFEVQAAANSRKYHFFMASCAAHMPPAADVGYFNADASSRFA